MEETKILIVDDTKEVLTALERELRDEQYYVFTAGSGDEALRIMHENEFKVIISDVKMPGMDGFELLARVRELYPDMIRVVLSGHSDIKLILEIVNEQGIERYLTKPWIITDVKSTIYQCLELYDLRKEVTELRSQHSKEGW